MSTRRLNFEDRSSYQDNITLCKGHVKIYKNNHLLIEKDNHIVITGRNWLMQRAFGLPFDLENQKHLWSLRWFSLGNGGTAIDAPFQPIWPTDEDVDVFNKIQFVLPTNRTGRHNEDCYKKLIDGISFESALTTKVTMTVAYDDCVNEYINEAGLFASPTEELVENRFNLFSHVTFPTIPKSNLAELTIEWYFIF